MSIAATRVRRLVIAAAVPVLVTSVIARSPAAAGDASSLLGGLDAQYDKVWNAHDARQLASLYSDNAVLNPPLAPADIGSNAVATFFSSLWKSKWSEHKLEPVSAHMASNNVMVAVSHWSANLTGSDGKTTRYHGDVAQVFRKIGDQWKIDLASWNVLNNNQ